MTSRTASADALLRSLGDLRRGRASPWRSRSAPTARPSALLRALRRRAASNGCLGRSFDLRQSGPVRRDLSPGGADGLAARSRTAGSPAGSECVYDSRSCASTSWPRAGTIEGTGRSRSAIDVDADRRRATARGAEHRRARPSVERDLRADAAPRPASAARSSSSGRPTTLGADAGPAGSTGTATYVNGRMRGRRSAASTAPARPVEGDAAERDDPARAHAPAGRRRDRRSGSRPPRPAT